MPERPIREGMTGSNLYVGHHSNVLVRYCLLYFLLCALIRFIESIDGRGMLRVDIGWYLVVSNREGRIVRTCEGAVEGREKRRSVYDYRGKNAIEVVPTRRKST